MERTSDPAISAFPVWGLVPARGDDRVRGAGVIERKASIDSGVEARTRELVERARRGEVAAFEALIAPHVPTVRRLAHAFARNWSDADDLAQDALVRAFRSIGTFEGRASFSTWLYVVVRSTFLDSKRARRRPERFADGSVDDLPETERDRQDLLVERKDESARLWAAIEKLDPTFRIALVLFAVEGMSYDEIAAIEEVPIGTVRSRIARARARLAELLAENDAREDASEARLRLVGRGSGGRSS